MPDVRQLSKNRIIHTNLLKINKRVYLTKHITYKHAHVLKFGITTNTRNYNACVSDVTVNGEIQRFISPVW